MENKCLQYLPFIMFNTDVQNLIVSGGLSFVDCQSYTLHVGFFNIKLNKQNRNFQTAININLNRNRSCATHRRVIRRFPQNGAYYISSMIFHVLTLSCVNNISIHISTVAPKIAQLGERKTEDLKGPSSTPPFGKLRRLAFSFNSQKREQEICLEF